MSGLPVRISASRVRALAGVGATARVTAGLAFVVAPRLIGQLWIGDEARGAGAATFAQALGTRDALLGLGALAALREGAPLRRWLLAGAISDAADALASALRPALPRNRRLLVAAVAGSSAVGFAWLAWREDALARS